MGEEKAMETKDTNIVVAGKLFTATQIQTVIPFKLGDWRILETYGVTPHSFGRAGGISIKVMAYTLFHVLHKLDPAITIEDIDNLELDDPALAAVFAAMQKPETEESVNVPFSPTSDGVPTVGDGDHETSSTSPPSS